MSRTLFESFVEANLCTYFLERLAEEVCVSVNDTCCRNDFSLSDTMMFEYFRTKKWNHDKKFDYLERTVTATEISPNSPNCFEQFLMRNSMTKVKRLISFLVFLLNFFQKSGQKLLPSINWYEKEYAQSLATISNPLAPFKLLWQMLQVWRCFWRNQAFQKVIFCDATVHGTGFVSMVQSYLINQSGEAKQFYAPVSVGSSFFTPFQFKLLCVPKTI